MKILFYDTKPYDKEFFNKYNKDYGFDIKYLTGKLTEESADLAKGYDVISVFVNDTVNKKVIDILVECGVKLIAMRCAGYNKCVILKDIDGRIKVVRVSSLFSIFYCRIYCWNVMTLNRKIHKAYIRTREGNFSITGLMGYDLHKKTAGIIGAGKIAQILIKILKGFGMKVIAYDPYPNYEKAKELGFEFTDLDTLYKEQI